MPTPLNLLVLGGCLLHGPLATLRTDTRDVSFSKYGSVLAVHSLGEMFQSIDVLRGEKDIPMELRSLCRMSPRLRADPNGMSFHSVDVALLEPNSPIEISFRDVLINRNAVMNLVVEPIRAFDSDAGRLAIKWFRLGLMAINDEVRSGMAAELLNTLPDEIEGIDMIRAVLNESHSFKSDVLDGFRTMQELLGRPIGVVVYTFQYLSDGRAISWPAGFREEILNAAKQVKLPVFNPTELVQKYGVETALDKDLRHYKNEFLPVVADAVIKFAESVASQFRQPTPA
jgi:hypothetical protein